MIEKLFRFLKIHFASNLTLKDGTSLVVEGNLETGVKVYVATADGNIPLPDGEYQLEDTTIILVKDGIIMDVVAPSQVDPNMEPVDATEEMSAEEKSIEGDYFTEEDLIAQKGNPDVSGLDPTTTETPIVDTTGTTAENMIDPTMPEMPEPADEEIKIAELETKVADLTAKVDEILGKMNMNEEKINFVTEKMSIANPIVRIASDSKMEIDSKLQSKIDLIKRLKKSGS